MIAEEDWSNVRYELERSTTISNIKKIAVWLALDCPEPPPSAYKQELVKKFAEHYGYKEFIETGTYYGQMIKAVAPLFERVHSIELSRELYQKTKNKFAKTKNIDLYCGDSGKILPYLLKKLKNPAVFWLDAHYSAGETARGDLETPIITELEAILNHKVADHIILIDDARLFNGTNDYPRQEALKKLLSKHKNQLLFNIRHDIIRMHPSRVDIEV